MLKTWAASALLNCSKCRSTRISRSSASMRLRALSRRRASSARMATSLGAASWPRSPGRQGGRADLRPGAPVQGHLPAGVAQLLAQVVAVQGDELLPGDQPQPQEEGDRAVARVIL